MSPEKRLIVDRQAVFLFSGGLKGSNNDLNHVVIVAQTKKAFAVQLKWHINIDLTPRRSIATARRVSIFAIQVLITTGLRYADVVR